MKLWKFNSLCPFNNWKTAKSWLFLRAILKPEVLLLKINVFFLNFLYFKFRCLKLLIHMPPWVINIFSKYDIYNLNSFNFIAKTLGSVLFETVIREKREMHKSYHCFKKNRTESFSYKIKTNQVVYFIFWENIYNSWGHMYRKF